MLDFIDKDSFFYLSALLGTGMFAVQFVISLFGSDGDHFDEDAGFDMDDASKVRWFSIQTITGFIMMFGWTGLTCHRQFQLNTFLSVFLALLVASFSIVIISFIFRSAKKLKSTVTVFNIEDSIGKKAMVYQRIPKDGVGKITISLKDISREIEAISLAGEELSSFTQVQIIKKMDNNTVVVIPYK